MKLNLASGQMYLDGYINVDNKSMYHGNMKVDKEADVFTLEWENNTVEEIILSHFEMYISSNLFSTSNLLILVSIIRVQFCFI